MSGKLNNDDYTKAVDNFFQGGWGNNGASR